MEHSIFGLKLFGIMPNFKMKVKVIGCKTVVEKVERVANLCFLLNSPIFHLTSHIDFFTKFNVDESFIPNGNNNLKSRLARQEGNLEVCIHLHSP